MDEAAASEGANYIILYIGLGLTSFAAFILLLYNLVVVISVMRNKEAEAASGMSKAAWGLSVLAVFLGPCAAPVGLVTVIMGMVETGRVYSEKSPLSSTTGARMAKTNGGVILVLAFVLLVFTGLTFMG